MRCAIYCRVSTVSQSTDMQRAALEPYAARLGWTTELYEDLGISGSKDTRPALSRLMEDARKGRIDVVLVFRFDRFARSTKHLATALEEFRARKVQFVSYSENIDTNTPIGALLFTILGAVGQLEREIIRERVQAGVNAARAKGKVLGRPVIHAHLANQAKQLRKDGKTLRAIGLILDISKDSVTKLLKL